MRPGEVIAARFEIERLAGAGGMGAVYRAHDRQSRATVAVKLVPGFEAVRFAREAAILADLSHPAIVRYIAHGVDDDGGLYRAVGWSRPSCSTSGSPGCRGRPAGARSRASERRSGPRATSPPSKPAAPRT